MTLSRAGLTDKNDAVLICVGRYIGREKIPGEIIFKLEKKGKMRIWDVASSLSYLHLV